MKTFMVLYQYDAYIGHAFFKNSFLAESYSNDRDGKEKIVEELHCHIPNVDYSDEEELFETIYCDNLNEADFKIKETTIEFLGTVYTSLETLAEDVKEHYEKLSDTDITYRDYCV